MKKQRLADFVAQTDGNVVSSKGKVSLNKTTTVPFNPNANDTSMPMNTGCKPINSIDREKKQSISLTQKDRKGSTVFFHSNADYAQTRYGCGGDKG